MKYLYKFGILLIIVGYYLFINWLFIFFKLIWDFRMPNRAEFADYNKYELDGKTYKTIVHAFILSKSYTSENENL